MEGKDPELIMEEISSRKTELEARVKVLDSGMEELNTRKIKYDVSITEFENSKKRMQDAQTEFENSKKRMQDAQTEFENSKKRMQDAQSEFENSKKRMQDASSRRKEAVCEFYKTADRLLLALGVTPKVGSSSALALEMVGTEGSEGNVNIALLESNIKKNQETTQEADAIVMEGRQSGKELVVSLVDSGETEAQGHSTKAKKRMRIKLRAYS